MRMVDLLDAKRQGRPLNGEQIAFFVDSFTASRIPDYQASAMLMAICLRGMNTEETTELTRAMLDSGDRFDFSHIDSPKMDKHSTGGVGDKTSFIVAPLAAACGLAVPMISGRALGHTGGTLDKLESIPGVRVALSPGEFREIVDDVGCVIAGQTETLAPADRKLYALRDVTGTVKSVPLITSSILAKKLAEGLDGLVFDVKVGSGAYMESIDDAVELARSLTGAAEVLGVEAVALLTDMNQPLGESIGNALEIEESIATLRGEGPTDVRELSLILVAEMLRLAGSVDAREQGVELARHKLDSGAALDVFSRMITAQGGDASAIDLPERLPRAAHQQSFRASASGLITEMNTQAIGRAAMLLGAGRREVSDVVSAGAGIRLHHKLGAAVSTGEAILTLLTDEQETLHDASQALGNAIRIGEAKPSTRQLVLQTISKERTV